MSKNFFSMLHLCVCLDLLQFVSLLTIYAVEQNVCDLLSRIHSWVTDQSWHTGPNDSVLHFELVFCILLISNWEVSSGCSLNNFINFAQTTQNFVINSYIEAIETKLSIGKAYPACIYKKF